MSGDDVVRQALVYRAEAWGTMGQEKILEENDIK